MSDVSEFLQSYGEMLRQGMADADIPPELTERFTFDSLIKRQEGREVWFVTRKSDGRRAVLRITVAEAWETSATEYAILSRLDHPAIPKMLGVWEHSGCGYMAREYFQGDDLCAYIRKHGELGARQLTDIALRLCDVLNYIHSQAPAIIHRDIKPENIIISDNGEVRLVDFGSARVFHPETERDTRVEGTKPYMAPEQFGSEQTDNRADIYSLGMVMIFMATGKPDKRNLRAAYPHKELLPVVEKCVRRDRERRYGTAERLKRRILWARRRVTQKILLGAAAGAAAAAAFAAGLFIGRTRGFQSGVASVMDVPTYKNRQFTPEELNEPVTFDSWYLDMAVRIALNKEEGDTIYRTEVTSRVDELRIYGTSILHPDLEDVLLKTHVGKGTVRYNTDRGFWIDARGDISALDDVTNLYYLRVLSLTSQSISDLSPLSGMKLEQINLSDNYIGNLLPLKDMVTLRELDICQNPVRDLTPISRLLSLELLDISQTQVTDLKPLAELTKLKTLYMNYCDVKDIGVLAELPNLREVDLSNTLVTDLTPLLDRSEPLTVRCDGLPDEVVAQIRDAENITVAGEDNYYE